MRRDMEFRNLRESRAPSLEAYSNRLVRMTAILVLLSSPVYAEESAEECSSVNRQSYLESARSKFYEHWQPPDYVTNISCTVLIKQNFRGEVLYVGIAKCTDDPQVHKSVINAGYEASPMPPPAVKACFRRDIIFSIESRTQYDD